MSPWPCRSLVATLCPDQVSVVQERSTLTRHGFARKVEWQHVAGVDPEAGMPPWRAALDSLPSALPRRTSAPTPLTVVLSNRFLRYALVPARAELVDRDEQLAYARHRFASVHGPAAQDWDVRLSRCAGGAAVASAVDARLVGGLQDLCRGTGLRLVSVQPRLMAAVNGARRLLATDHAWLALVEPGHLCLGLLHRGAWQRLRTARDAHPWRDQLCVLLERECFQAGGPALPEDVYVWHARERLEELPQSARWRFHAVQSRRGADPQPT